MTRRSSIHLAIAVLSFAYAADAWAQLEWRVSVKFILDPSENRAASGNLILDQDVRDRIDAANAILDAGGRGYRFRLVEIVDLAGVSQWFDADVSAATRNGIEDAAADDPDTYAWSTDEINIYVLGTSSSFTGYCSGPSSDRSTVILGQNANVITMFHECGHFYGLCHTHGCGINSSDCDDGPGDDTCDDTLPDNSCWDEDQIAQYTYGRDYDQLSGAQREWVDGVWFNVMSYHNFAVRDRLSPDQLDRAADTSNDQRFNTTTGRTRFVGAGGDVETDPDEAAGASKNPWSTLGEGLANADEGDIVLLRVGSYSEPMLIDQRVYLRASRGNAIIGEP